MWAIWKSRAQNKAITNYSVRSWGFTSRRDDVSKENDKELWYKLQDFLLQTKKREAFWVWQWGVWGYFKLLLVEPVEKMFYWAWQKLMYPFGIRKVSNKAKMCATWWCERLGAQNPWSHGRSKDINQRPKLRRHLRRRGSLLRPFQANYSRNQINPRSQFTQIKTESEIRKKGIWGSQGSKNFPQKDFRLVPSHKQKGIFSFKAKGLSWFFKTEQ